MSHEIKFLLPDLPARFASEGLARAVALEKTVKITQEDLNDVRQYYRDKKRLQRESA